MIDLSALHKRQAKRLMQLYSRRLLQGRGAGNQILRPKKRPDGNRLGAGVIRSLRQGTVTARSTGFTIEFGDDVERFHVGRPNGGQPARPVVDLPEEDLRRNAQEVLELIRREGRRTGLFK